MSNPRRYLNKEKEAIYKNYLEERGEDFKKNDDSRYRMPDDLYDSLFSDQKISGRSTLYDSEGKVMLEWVKTSQDKERAQQLIKELIDGMKDNIPKYKPLPFKARPRDKDLINQYTITDYHLGMMAWREESGDDWDLKIAEDLLVKWFQYAIETSPKAESCVFAEMGDFIHWDGLAAVTPQNRHLLDADTRFTKLVRVAIRVVRRIINMLLDKYKSVYVKFCEGNHNEASSVWMREAFFSFYENESRVEVDINPDPYYGLVFGNTLLLYHHGHKRTITNVDSVFVAKFKEDFGRCKHVYGHLGHYHKFESLETNLMILERHRTLAAKDSYASRGGFGSGRDAKVITYHKEHGEVGRLTINPDIV